MAENIVGLQRIATAVRSPDKLELDEIAVFGRAIFHWCERCRPLTRFLQRSVDVFVGDGHSRHLDVEALVFPKLKFREYFKNGSELERLTLVEVELVHLGLRNGAELMLGHRLFHFLRNQRLQHFTLDIVSVAPLDQRNRSFSWAEPGDAGHTRN